VAGTVDVPFRVYNVHSRKVDSKRGIFREMKREVGKTAVE
jgi:hypothetical protein